MKEIVLIGYGGHGKSVADAIESAGKYHIIGYTDPQKGEEDSVPYLGTDEELERIFRRGVRHAAIGVGYMGKGTLRDLLYQKASGIGFEFPVIIDPSAAVSLSAKIGEGTFIGKNAVVNAWAEIGKLCIINSGAILEHECRVGDFSHVSVGAAACGQAIIGHHCFIGARSILIQNVTVGNERFVKAGQLVTGDLEDGPVRIES